MGYPLENNIYNRTFMYTPLQAKNSTVFAYEYLGLSKWLFIL